jgi:divalent metal cation (Fe/Co/Zn/Cd) transporter
LITPTPIEVGLGVLVMLFSALVNSGVSAYLYRVAKEEESVALAADALHLKADVLTSLGVAVGLLGIWIADRLGYNLYLLDPVVAICVALFILKEAIAKAGLPTAAGPQHERGRAGHHYQSDRRVLPEHGGFHDLRSRQAGRRRHIDFHLTLPKEMSIEHSTPSAIG